jgi:hypothetical protein
MEKEWLFLVGGISTCLEEERSLIHWQCDSGQA